MPLTPGESLPEPISSSPEEEAEEMKNILTNFINKTPEYQNRNFTSEEIELAAKVLANNLNLNGVPNDEIAKKALDARLSLRRTNS